MKLYALIFLISVSCNVAARDGEHRRAGGLSVPVPNPDPTDTASNTATTTTTTTPPTSSSTGIPSSTSSTPPASASTTLSSTGQSATTGIPSVTGPSMTSQPSNTDLSQTQSSTSEQQSTSFVTTTPSDSSATASSSSSAPSNIGKDDGDNNSSVGTGTIVGLSVAGGIAVLGAVAFIIWKFTRKRFSEFDVDGEEIKWPELGHESHALPTRPTGRVGVDDDGFDDAGVEGAGRHLGSNYAPSSATGEASMADLHSYNDPYAVPPLPHLDPNQAYHDDPSNYGGHYDPYQGPVPQSFHDPAAADRMSSRSPAPANYGRQSPGPSQSYPRAGY